MSVVVQNTAGFLTVIVQVAFTFPAVAVIVAVPAFLPVTLPFTTVATDAFEVDHFTLLAAEVGSVIALSVTLSPTPRPVAVLSSLTLFAAATIV